MKPRVILSVYNKMGLTGFGRQLAQMGWELVASGGTARELAGLGLTVREVSAVTGAPEMLGGRVKTLHPAVHGGILARDIEDDRDDLAANGIKMVDMVVCNLYPFEETIAAADVTVADAIEQIDIGGVTLLRAAAKNFNRVTVVSDPMDYGVILNELKNEGHISAETRQRLALKAFQHTRDYDTAISAWMASLTAEEGGMPATVSLNLTQTQTLRYGENPHQSAGLYAADPNAGPLGGQLLQGKPLSYNNLLDVDAAWRAAESYADPTVVIVKHLCPCGIATAESADAAFGPALASDPVSAFGGVIAVNRPVDGAFAEKIREAKLFVEAIVAPSFSQEARTYFAEKKKNCRLIALGSNVQAEAGLEIRSIKGGVLIQDRDMGDPETATWNVVSERQPSAAEEASLRTAWEAVNHVKSNAIVFAQGNATVGIGGGMSSRIDAVELAAKKSGEQAQGAAMASDAFFPFADGIEAAAAAGVTAVVQPGGSVRDAEVIEAVNKLGLAMVLTGTRHFRH
ncbi:MAG: bifunctional phosphoribosylaminoimidazolecarboxamide formyltransferase/IMP cyclohydrolase [Chloroflexota bacterium]